MVNQGNLAVSRLGRMAEMIHEQRCVRHGGSAPQMARALPMFADGAVLIRQLIGMFLAGL